MTKADDAVKRVKRFLRYEKAERICVHIPMEVPDYAYQPNTIDPVLYRSDINAILIRLSAQEAENERLRDMLNVAIDNPK